MARKQPAPTITFPCAICGKGRTMEKHKYEYKTREGYRPCTCGRVCSRAKRIKDTEARRAA